MGSPVNIPLRMSLGQYYAQVVFPADCNIGDWVIRWTIQEASTDPVYQSVEMFNVIGDSTIISFTGDASTDYLIHKLRILLRDNNPDRNYRFRPPESAKFIQGQTQVFGFFWEDEELLEYIYMAIDDFNTYPPVTGIELGDLAGSLKRWRTVVLYRAACLACLGATLTWALNEFSVSGNELIPVKDENGNEYRLTLQEFFNIIYDEDLKKFEDEIEKEIVKLKEEVKNEII
jgi:hypothetical protein